MMNALRELEDDRVYQNVSELMRLQTAVAEGLKRFEFDLRRKVEGDREPGGALGLRRRAGRVPPARRAGTTARWRKHRGETARRPRGRAGARPGHGRCRAVRVSWLRPRGAPPRFPTADTFGQRLQLLPRHLPQRPRRGRRPGLVHRLSRRRAELLDPPLGADQDARAAERRRRAGPPDGAPDRRRSSSSVPTCTWRTWARSPFSDDRGGGAARLPAEGRLRVGGRLLGQLRLGQLDGRAGPRAAAVRVPDPGRAARASDLQVAAAA